MQTITDKDMEMLLSEYENAVVWGMGAMGRHVAICNYALWEETQLYLCDSDDDKIKQCDRGIKPENIRNLVGKTIIIICIKNHDWALEVYDRLRECGVAMEHVYLYERNELVRQEEISLKRKKGYFNGSEVVTPMKNAAAVELLQDYIKSGREFLYSRWGNVEAENILGYRLGFMPLASLSNNAGVFPLNHEGINSFSDECLFAAKAIDILCAWFFIDGEELLYEKCSSGARLCSSVLEYPFDKSVAWTRALYGKKVLVIHPFAELIKKQYLKREYIWKDSDDILPKFELATYKAVQSIGGVCEYDSWTQALHKMENDISLLDFDIALIGCGAYGMPLGAYIKRELHKQAIHMGGSLQILFGIKGKRWEGEPYHYDTKYYNEHWVRPDDDLKPANYKAVENGCYW